MSSIDMPAVALQPAQQLQHLRLDGHVQRRGRLVGDQQAGMAGERDGDHHALLHAAGHLERILVEAARRVGNADRVEQLAGPARRRIAAQVRVPRQHLGDLRADRHHRIEAQRRLLEDHRHAAAAHAAHGELGQAPAGPFPPARRARPRCGRPRAAGASATAPSSTCRSRTRPPARRSRRGRCRRTRRPRPAARRAPCRARSTGRRPRAARALCWLAMDVIARPAPARKPRQPPAGADARIEGIAHRIGEQVGRQHQHEHEDEGGRQRPPDHRLARQLQARVVDHGAEADHRRIDADARRRTAPPRPAPGR